MTITLVEFRAEHVRQLRAQPAQVRELNADTLATPYGQAWTAMVADVPMACAGIVEVWTGRSYCWALLSADVGPHLLALTRAIRSRLAALPLRRVEMAVDAGFAPGCRWAEMLGFVRETPRPMRSYLPNGRDAWLYARVSDGDGNGELDCNGGNDRDGQDL